MGHLKILASSVALFAMTGCGFSEFIGASRAYNYATVPHVSKHLNSEKDFNENNFGVGIGSEAPLNSSKWSVGVETGIYKNSNDETSPYALTYAERDMLDSNPRALRLGVFTGYARYPSEADRFRDRFPVIGDFIPVIGLQATVPTFGPHEFRFRVAPGLNKSSAIVSLQSNFVF